MAGTGALNLPGDVGDSTTSYGADDKDYYRLTYGKGAAALRAARDAAGPAAFDAAIRCYVNANAWRIAEPSDLANALRDLPAALSVLERQARCADLASTAVLRPQRASQRASRCGRCPRPGRRRPARRTAGRSPGVPKASPGHDRDLGLVEDRARPAAADVRGAPPRERPAEQALDRRVGVERALRLGADDPGMSVSSRTIVLPAPIERRRASPDRGQVAGRPRRARPRWDTLATLEVECDCRLVAALMTSAGPIIQPTRQPVIAYVLATPLSTMHWSASSGTTRRHRDELVRRRSRGARRSRR